MSDISKQVSQHKRYGAVREVELNDMDEEQEASDIEEHPDDKSYEHAKT